VLLAATLYFRRSFSADVSASDDVRGLCPVKNSRDPQVSLMAPCPVPWDDDVNANSGQPSPRCSHGGERAPVPSAIRCDGSAMVAGRHRAAYVAGGHALIADYRRNAENPNVSGGASCRSGHRREIHCVRDRCIIRFRQRRLQHRARKGGRHRKGSALATISLRTGPSGRRRRDRTYSWLHRMDRPA